MLVDALGHPAHNGQRQIFGHDGQPGIKRQQLLVFVDGAAGRYAAQQCEGHGDLFTACPADELQRGFGVFACPGYAQNAAAHKRRFARNGAEANLPGNFGFAQILDAVNMVNEHIEHGGIAAREAIHTGRPQAVVAGNVVGVRVHLGIAAQRLLPGLAFQTGAAVTVKEPAAHGKKAGQKLAADAVDGIGRDGRAIFKRRQGIKGAVKEAKQIAVLLVVFRNVQLRMAAFIIETADFAVVKEIFAIKVQLHVGREGEGIYLPIHHREGLANTLKHGRPDGLHGVAGRIKGAQQLGRNGG